MQLLSESWAEKLGEELAAEYFSDLASFVATERAQFDVFPPEADVFRAFDLTPFDNTKVLLLGQDPYHGPGQAHGLCFSVRPGIRTPPSLGNIYKELQADIGFEIPQHGFLESWAKQGILMLNTVLTVRSGEANSHRKNGWEVFTDAVIRAVSRKTERVVFVLWGKPAQKKLKLIDSSRHVVIESAHPSPLSARNGFFGSRPFSRINEALAESGQQTIDWQLPRDAQPSN